MQDFVHQPYKLLGFERLLNHEPANPKANTPLVEAKAEKGPTPLQRAGSRVWALVIEPEILQLPPCLGVA